MTALDYRNAVSIFELVYYSPALLIAIYLNIKHGFGRSSGWFFLIIFSLARLIGPAMQLATISAPTNISLYVGSAVLQNIGLSPLLLCSLGLLSRVISSINRTKMTFITPRYLQFVELVVFVGLILGIVGGINAGTEFGKTFRYVPQTTSKASVILFLAAWIFLAVATGITFLSIGSAVHGEKRLLIAIALSVPFLLVRTLYSLISAFSGPSSHFNALTGSVTILLVMALIMEAIVVFFYETVGITLRKEDRLPVAMGQNSGEETRPDSRQPMHHQAGKPTMEQNDAPRKKENVFLTIAKNTIIGRIVMMFVGGNDRRRGEDVEMRGQNGRY